MDKRRRLTIDKEQAVYLSEKKHNSMEDELEHFRVAHLSELSHRANEQKKAEINLQLQKAIKAAEADNRGNLITHILRMQLSTLIFWSFNPCSHCQDTGKLCLHVSSHDLLLLAKMSGVCKVWKEFVDEWFKTNASKIEIQAFSGNSKTLHDLKLQKKGAHTKKANVFLGYAVTFTWDKGELTVSNSEKRGVQNLCMCCDARWKLYAKTIGKRFKIVVNDPEKQAIDFMNGWFKKSFQDKGKIPRLSLTCNLYLPSKEDLPCLGEKVKQLVKRIQSERMESTQTVRLESLVIELGK